VGGGGRRGGACAPGGAASRSVGSAGRLGRAVRRHRRRRPAPPARSTGPRAPGRPESSLLGFRRRRDLDSDGGGVRRRGFAGRRVVPGPGGCGRPAARAGRRDVVPGHAAAARGRRGDLTDWPGHGIRVGKLRLEEAQNVRRVPSANSCRISAFEFMLTHWQPASEPVGVSESRSLSDASPTVTLRLGGPGLSLTEAARPGTSTQYRVVPSRSRCRRASPAAECSLAASAATPSLGHRDRHGDRTVSGTRAGLILNNQIMIT
jgi:hypothetical protein